MRKLWKYFILCSVVLLSLLLNLSIVKNSNAVELVIPVNFTGKSWTANNIECKYSDGVTKTMTGGNCVLPYQGWSGGAFTQGLTQLITTDPIPTTKGYYYKANLVIKSDDGLPYLLWNFETTSSWTFVSIKEISADEAKYRFNFQCETAPTMPQDCISVINFGTVWESKYAKFYEVTLQSKSDGGKRWSFGDGSRKVIDTKDGTLNNVFVGIFNIQEFKLSNAEEEMNEKDNEDRSNIESQSSQTESDAEDSKEDIEQGTSSLISTISSFSTMLTGIHTTNCKLPEIAAYGFNLGRIDICTFSPPSWVSIVGNVIVSLIAVRLAIAIFRRIMGIIKGVGQ